MVAAIAACLAVAWILGRGREDEAAPVVDVAAAGEVHRASAPIVATRAPTPREDASPELATSAADASAPAPASGDEAAAPPVAALAAIPRVEAHVARAITAPRGEHTIPRTGREKPPRDRETRATPDRERATGRPTQEAPRDPEKARQAYNAGNQALFAGDTDRAIEAYRESVRLGSAAGYRGLGLAYSQRGDKARAIKSFQKYLSKMPAAKDVPLIKKRIAALRR